MPYILTQAPSHVFPFAVGKSSGLRWQHISGLLAGRPRPARVSAQLPVQWLPHAGVREEPVGAGDCQRK